MLAYAPHQSRYPLRTSSFPAENRALNLLILKQAGQPACGENHMQRSHDRVPTSFRRNQLTKAETEAEAQTIDNNTCHVTEWTEGDSVTSQRTRQHSQAPHSLKRPLTLADESTKMHAEANSQPCAPSDTLCSLLCCTEALRHHYTRI